MTQIEDITITSTCFICSVLWESLGYFSGRFDDFLLGQYYWFNSLSKHNSQKMSRGTTIIATKHIFIMGILFIVITNFNLSFSYH